MTSKYAILERLALYNWVPSNHQISVLKPMTVLLYKLGKGISFNLVHEEELCEKSAGEMCISKKFFQGQYIQDIQGELIYPDLVVGVQKGVVTLTAGETIRFVRSELALLEAQERNLTVRKAEIISFLRTLGVVAASSSAGAQVPVDQATLVEEGGVPPSVPALAVGVDVASSSVLAQPIIPAP